MAIEYVEIRNLALDIVGIIDTAKSIIWHSMYYGVGDFEIYAPATDMHLSLLQKDYYVTRPDDLEVGIITNVHVIKSVQDGKMIVASGKFAKSLLNRRLIYQLSGTVNKPTILRGNVETNIRNVVSNNIISCSWNIKRNMSQIELGAVAGLPQIIVDENGNPTEKQVSYQNLQEYTDEVLKEYELASMLILNEANNKLQFVVYNGVNRAVDNTDGNEPIIFSEEFDNLVESEYSTDNSNEKNFALVGGEGEGLQRFYSVVNDNQEGINRKELWVDASSINKKYKDDQDVEHEYTTAEYRALLQAEGKTKLAEFIQVESFSGTINTANGQWVLNRDFALGDIVTVQDNQIGIYANVRVLETTEVQDENGYSAEVNYA